MNENATKFITDSIGEYDRIEKLAGDASTREYFRIYSHRGCYILCMDNNFLNTPLDNYPFYIINQIFRKNHIPVPEIYFMDNANGLLLIQDMGDNVLELVYSDLSNDRIIQIYRELIDIIIEIQLTDGENEFIPFNLSFDVNKLMFEFDFFIQHALLSYFNAKISANELEKLRDEFLKISEILYNPALFVLNHRDFHSRNIIIFQSEPYIIDFQDARMGLPQYDIVSLLKDSYLALDERLVENLCEYHFHGLKKRGYTGMTRSEYEYYFDIMAFQRNIKAIGTFGYQVTSPGNMRYEKYIAPTLGYLKDYIMRRKELKGAAEILQSHIEADW